MSKLSESNGLHVSSPVAEFTISELPDGHIRIQIRAQPPRHITAEELADVLKEIQEGRDGESR